MFSDWKASKAAAAQETPPDQSPAPASTVPDLVADTIMGEVGTFTDVRATTPPPLPVSAPLLPPSNVPVSETTTSGTPHPNTIVVYRCSHCHAVEYDSKAAFRNHRRVAACGGRAVHIATTMEDDMSDTELAPAVGASRPHLATATLSMLVPPSPPTDTPPDAMANAPNITPIIPGMSPILNTFTMVDVNIAPIDVGPPQSPISGILDPSVPPESWFLIEAKVHDPTGFASQVWFDTFTTSGLLALKVPRAPSNTLLLVFKSVLRRDMLLAYLSHHLQAYGLASISHFEKDINVGQFDARLSLTYITHSYHRQRSPEDLDALLSRAPPSRMPPPSLMIIGKNNRNQWIAEHGGGHNAWKADFFEWHIWPVRFGAPREFPPGGVPLRQIDVIEFTLDWLDNWLLTDPVAQTTFEYQRLRVMMHAYQHPGRGTVASDFFVLMLQTVGGPYEAILRRIARMRRGLDIPGWKVGTKTRCLRRYESFGFVKDSAVWRLEVDLGRDHPQYPVPFGMALQNLKR